MLGAVLALGATLLARHGGRGDRDAALYGRDHLDQVLGTFGLILFFNELVRLIWGPAGLTLAAAGLARPPVQILPGVYYPTYRLVIIVVDAGGRAAALHRS